MERNIFTKPDVDMQWFLCSQRSAPGTPTDQLHQHPAVLTKLPPPPFVPPLPPHQHSLPGMLQCLSSALQVLHQTNENCRLMSSIAGFSAEWEAHYNDHFAENHARLQAECQQLLAQQYTIIESTTSPVNAVHQVEQLDAKHHSMEALPMQKGRRTHTIDDEDTVNDSWALPSIEVNRNNLVEDDATAYVTQVSQPWPHTDIPGQGSPSPTSGNASSCTSGLCDVINSGSLSIDLLHFSSQLHKPVSRHHLRNFNMFPADVKKHINLLCDQDQLFLAVRQLFVAIGSSSSPRTTRSHRPRLRPRTRWKLDKTSIVVTIIITAQNGPLCRNWSITSSLFLEVRVVC